MNSIHTQAPRLLIVGTGDVAWRALPWLLQRFRVFALCRSQENAVRWRMAGAVPVIGDLDSRHTLRRLRGLAHYVLHAAPPATEHAGDPRTKRLLAALKQGQSLPRKVVYISTTGVYGDCAGARIKESQPRKAANPRARRRVEAESLLRSALRALPASARRPLCRAADRLRSSGSPPGLVILRAPGIYAADRLPTSRLRAGTPALLPAEDGYTSHIHAEDLAMAAALACFRVRGGRALNVNDQTELKMGEWFDTVADAFGLARPARISRLEAEHTLPAPLLSFMRESRRLDNTRLREELRLRLKYRDVQAGLAAALNSPGGDHPA